MSVDVFGRNLKKNEGSRGPPGFGFKITSDGQYDLDNKRLCNVAAPHLLNEAVNLDTLHRILRTEIQRVTDASARFTSDLNNLDFVVEAHRDEIDAKIMDIQADLNHIKAALREISEGNHLLTVKVPTPKNHGA